MFSRFKRIKPRLLLVHMIVTLGYPAARALTAEQNRLLIFTDAMTVIACVLVICGIIYSLVLHGDFDRSGYVLMRSARANHEKSYQAYMDDKKEERKEAFNYPFFLGIVYLIASVIIGYIVL